jgi:malic enzyme
MRLYKGGMDGPGAAPGPKAALAKIRRRYAARDISEEMKLAAAHAIAEIITPEELRPDHVVPSFFNRDVAKLVAAAVMQAAVDTGVAGRRRLATGKDSQ